MAGQIITLRLRYIVIYPYSTARLIYLCQLPNARPGFALRHILNRFTSRIFVREIEADR